MARVSYTVYKNSILATIISFVSRMIAAFGLMAAIGGVVDGEFGLLGAGAFLFVVFGIGGTALAEAINTYQSNVKWWKNAVRKQGWEAQIPNSVDVCFKVYNANPNKWTLNKIRKLNPSGAVQIQRSLGATLQKGDQNGKKTLIVCLAVLAVLAVVFGAKWILDSSTPKQTEVYSLTDYAYTDLEGSTIYKVDDLTVVDSFAQNTHTVDGKVTSTTDYYLVLYPDGNNRTVAAILSVDDDDDIYFRLSFYSMDDSQSIGDCTVNGFVKTRKNTNTELTGYFNEAVDKYETALGVDMISPEWMLVYHCNESVDPLK